MIGEIDVGTRAIVLNDFSCRETTQSSSVTHIAAAHQSGQETCSKEITGAGELPFFIQWLTEQHPSKDGNSVAKISKIVIKIFSLGCQLNFFVYIF